MTLKQLLKLLIKPLTPYILFYLKLEKWIRINNNHGNHKRKNIKRGEIRLCDLEKANGSIQGGVRPVLIVQNNKGNKYSPLAIVCPITSKTKYKAFGLKETSLLLTEQIITVNKFSIGRKITVLPSKLMEVADKRIQISLSLPEYKHKNIYFRKNKKFQNQP